MGVLATRARFVTESFFSVFQLHVSPLFNKGISSFEKSISVLVMILG
jgi:hypothetical protein